MLNCRGRRQEPLFLVNPQGSASLCGLSLDPHVPDHVVSVAESSSVAYSWDARNKLFEWLKIRNLTCVCNCISLRLYDMRYVFGCCRMGFVSLPRLLYYFTGDDDLLLSEQYDALGYDLRFRGWDL